MKTSFRPWATIVLLSLTTSCSILGGELMQNTPYPTELMPTFIALTIQASGYAQAENHPNENINTPVPTNIFLSGEASPTIFPKAGTRLEPSDQGYKNHRSTPTGKWTSEPAIISTDTDEPENLFGSTPILSTATQPSPIHQHITVTPTQTPNSYIPYAKTQFIQPGSGSFVVSPIKLIAYLNAGADGKVTIDLIGEDGRVLSTKTIAVDANPGDRISITTEMEFETRLAGELGRLQISINDRYGRMSAKSSIRLMMFSLGESTYNPPGDLLEDIIIRQPFSKAVIQGGTLSVSGLARVNIANPLIVELIDSTNRILASQQVKIQASNSLHGEFKVDILYKVAKPTWVQLVVRAVDDRIPGTMYLTSKEILVSP